MVCLPKRPLSITASALWICGPVMGRPPDESREGATKVIWYVPVFDGSPRMNPREPLPRTGPASIEAARPVRVRMFSCESNCYGEGSGSHGGRPLPRRRLTAQTELLDQCAVTRDVRLLQVLEQPTALADQQQQPTTAVVVLLVRLQVLREVVDAVREQRDLDLGRARVALGTCVFGDDLLLRGGVGRHGTPCL